MTIIEDNLNERQTSCSTAIEPKLEKKEIIAVGGNVLSGQFYLEHLVLINLEEISDRI